MSISSLTKNGKILMSFPTNDEFFGRATFSYFQLFSIFSFIPITIGKKKKKTFHES